MKLLLSLFTLPLTVLVTRPCSSQTLWSYRSYQEDNHVIFITTTNEASNNEQLKAAPVISESRELLTLPNDIRGELEQFFESRDDVFFNFLPKPSRDDFQF